MLIVEVERQKPGGFLGEIETKYFCGGCKTELSTQMPTIAPGDRWQCPTCSIKLPMWGCYKCKGFFFVANSVPQAGSELYCSCTQQYTLLEDGSIQFEEKV